MPEPDAPSTSHRGPDEHPDAGRTALAEPDADPIAADRVATDRARSDRAIGAARARTRRLWRIWGVALVVFLLAVAGVIVKVWSTSEIRHVSDHPATVSPSPLPTSSLSGSLSPAWHAGALALGTPLSDDVVVTSDEHTVYGNDARTGKVRWYYRRTDRQLCDVIAADGTAVAIYQHDGNCDEVTGLDQGTGKRTWNRTFFESGTDIDVSALNNQVLVRTPQSLHLFDSGGGLDYWYSPNVSDTPCAVGPAVLGTNGVLVTQNCAGKRTLSLESTGVGDKDGRPKPLWSVAQNGVTPLSADAIVSALSADHRSVVQLTDAGKTETTVRLAAALDVDEPRAVPLESGSIEILALRSEVLALTRGRPTPLWYGTRSSGVTSLSNADPVASDEGLLVVGADPSPVVLRLNTLSGQAEQRIAVDVDPSAALHDRAYPLADGLLVGGTSATAAYLPR